MDKKNLALEAIRKKLVGEKLSYEEIYAVMDEIAHARLGDVLTTYFVASGYSEGFTDEELYYLTRAMVETGERLHFRGIVADKHSIGGTPGARLTLIVVPIIAAAGFKMPKSSSRAITTPAGTADAMETLAPVAFNRNDIYRIVRKVGACIVWGGSFKIAPADDEIIKIEEPLVFESYDKIVVSVMAKKVAFGATHVIIDLPYGPTVKMHKIEDAEVLKRKFEYLGKKFKIKVSTFIHKVTEPAGRGIGPILETRDSLAVLENRNDRPMELEYLAIELARLLFDICLEKANKEIVKKYKEKYKNTHEWAADILWSGKALEKFKEIIKAQGGDPNVNSATIQVAKYCLSVRTERTGKILQVSNKNITTIAKVLGAPVDKRAGLVLNKRLGDGVRRDDELFMMYSDSEYRLKEAKDSLSPFPIFEIG